MGTNYYTKINECEKCGRNDTIHLGKSSAGWQFSFQYNGGIYYKNADEMKQWLRGRRIIDEYGHVISHEAFWHMVKAKQTDENQNHAQYCHKNYPETRAREHIIDGYSFSDCEFS